ncbi:hypothetical protein LCGC14_2531640, partial [marine sediment metagenome]
MASSYGVQDMSVYLTPGDTLLFTIQAEFMPVEGMFIDYLDAETSIITRYRVSDVIIEVLEKAPGPPPGGGGPGDPQRHFSKLRVEVVTVP